MNGTVYTTNLTITNSSSDAATTQANTPNPGDTQATQDFTNATFSFRQVGTNANVLTVVSSSNPVITRLGSDAAAITTSNLGGRTLNFTSDFLNFSGSTERAAAFSFTALNPNSSLGSNSYLDSTSFSGTGTFSTNVAPTNVVPEPGAVAFAMAAGAGMVGMMIRARRRIA